MQRFSVSQVLFFSVSLMSLSSIAQVAAENSNRSYPYQRPGMATISSVGFSSPTPANLIRIQTSNPKMQNVVSLKGQGHVKSVYWPGRVNKPLVLMIPGIGGYSDRGNIGDLAKIFQSWGYNVVTFDNPMNWQFALTLIPDGAPGYFPEDAKILYDNMISVTNQLKQNYGLKYSKTMIVSYSLGCQYTADLLKIDDQKRAFNFSDALMINPPLDLGYALHKFDRLNKFGAEQAGGRSSLTNYEKARGKLIDVYSNLMGVDRSKAVSLYAQNYPLNDYESEVVIGGSFKDSFEEILYVTSLVHPDRKAYFKSQVSEFHRQDRYNEINKFSFFDYFQNFILQKMSVRSQFLDNENLLDSFSLRRKIVQLHEDDRIKFVLVKDDPIASPQDIQLFSDTFRDRALVLNHGGHSGFYWFPGFAADLKDFLKP